MPLSQDILARRVKTLRRKRRLTQQELAARADITPAYVTHIESRNRAPSLDVLDSLAEALGVAPWELLTDRRLPPDPYRSTDRLLARALHSLTPPDLELLLDVARRLAAR